MNKTQFEKDLKQRLTANNVDIAFLGRWFDKTLKRLQTMSDQRSGISHPRHRGEAREKDILSVFREMFPENFLLQRGFVVNKHTTMSCEQDIIVLDGDSAGSLIRAGELAYFPIESTLASVEVKSNLTLAELRRSLINCVSIKKLLFGDAYCAEKAEDDKSQLCYAIFAFSCSRSLKRLADQLNKLIDPLCQYS